MYRGLEADGLPGQESEININKQTFKTMSSAGLQQAIHEFQFARSCSVPNPRLQGHIFNDVPETYTFSAPRLAAS